MITTELNFMPFIVWAEEDGFHIFGYKDKVRDMHVYCHQQPSGEQTLYNYHFPDKYLYFSHVYVSQWYTYLIHHRNGYFCLGETMLPLTLIKRKHWDMEYAFNIRLSQVRKSHPLIIGKTLNTCYDVNESSMSSLCHTIPPQISRYDYNDDHLVFACNNNLWINNYVIPTGKPCKNIKISPDGKTIAFGSGTKINFMDIETKLIKYTLNYQYIQYFAYSLDGLTLAVISDNNLIVWDME